MIIVYVMFGTRTPLTPLHKGGNVAVHFREVVFIQLGRGLKEFELVVDAGIFGKIEESGGFIIKTVEKSEFSFRAEEGKERLSDSRNPPILKSNLLLVGSIPFSWGTIQQTVKKGFFFTKSRGNPCGFPKVVAIVVLIVGEVHVRKCNFFLPEKKSYFGNFCLTFCLYFRIILALK